ncbi:type I phosphodiesterase/nucleotide pyrophosphatase [Chthoniobacter flavus Ellin428]|uniref:Type I phosphodiesterase/nucleotide pyrophosphatase n=1 Tax=Chthoniobacter flavus Ellin428 TaxID=497964 RepID=B4D427_9BACT|nr:ectonucleotide pyrophosphatase/phosphodiesterase [Chthoniobacter flavus]EDY19007.1 type I phosphodiesterase/nucleotide pyrophosphatase [Chthoniobacter flavus Ellin428]TCO93588.1 putative AlkP superfamily pyrophosphatase or phosphodiesterase [Chthoniobacter flavus]
MKRLCSILALSAAFLTPALALDPVADRIVVLISVDGLAHYYFDDPKAEMPTIRQLAAEGAHADRMKCSMPTVTWPNHTTLVTGVNPGKHGVIGNSYLDRARGTIVALIPDPIFNKDEIVQTPTVYDVAKAAGLKTAGIIWPASRGAKTLDWTVPDVFTDDLFQKYGTPSLLTEFKAAGIPYEKQGMWCKSGDGESRDHMYAQMLDFVVHTHRPNLALLHLVEVDHVEHAKGPQTPEAYAAVKFADERVREVWDELKKDYPGKATLIVASDHGFFPYQQMIQPNVLLRKEGLLTAEGTKITGGKVRSVGQGGATFIYVLDQANRDALIASLAEKFKSVEGVQLVITPKDYAKYGMVDPQKNPKMADLVLSAKKGYSFSDSLAGDLVVTPKTDDVKGTHGYDSNEDGMHGTFVVWGAGIKPGAKLGTINNTDVAPTIADLLGLKMPETDGQVLESILTK